ncbi:alkaline phosphatase [uncultured Draconibacterium sp.]|uniref:alkaline phosphatase n=1 Tax=uncultured Draconibacterium sp. TaxID=1573823 RepID=UPI002AA84924|nr:alkaline phosphatase [uncultured Draconibacterium sp.]
MKIQIITLVLCIVFAHVSAQENYKEQKFATEKVSQNQDTHSVKIYSSNRIKKKPKNLILFIGDGMGVSHVFAGLTANKGHLFLENFKSVGFSKTQSADDFVTDSAAGGTAISTGVKTNNGVIGLDPEGNPVKTILEIAEEEKLATGLVSTSAITHATPASFIAHQPKRNMYEDIAADFLKTDVDLFIGGGYKHFTDREDRQDLTKQLIENDYQVIRTIGELSKISSGKVAGLIADEHNGRVAERGSNYLSEATKKAIDILKNDDDGFFLMVEGSQIDWGGHQNNTGYIVEEMLDLDKAIGEALKFAEHDGETLIIVTADHETGGLGISDGDFATGKVEGEYTTSGHSAVMVPIFAFGPGATEFQGIMENTDIFRKMYTALFK